MFGEWNRPFWLKEIYGDIMFHATWKNNGKNRRNADGKTSRHLSPQNMFWDVLSTDTSVKVDGATHKRQFSRGLEINQYMKKHAI